MSGKNRHKRARLSQKKRRSPKDSNEIIGIIIPDGDSKDAKKARKQIIKDFYARWIAANQDKRVWNRSLGAFIYVKGKSINETSGQASTSYESTKEVFRLNDILSNATIYKIMAPKRDSENQKPYSEMLIMRHGSALLVVGKQETTGEYVQYCISARDKK